MKKTDETITMTHQEWQERVELIRAYCFEEGRKRERVLSIAWQIGSVGNPDRLVSAELLAECSDPESVIDLVPRG